MIAWIPATMPTSPRQRPTLQPLLLRPFLSSLLCAMLLFGTSLIPGTANAAVPAEPLTLDVRDSTALPGGVLAVVLRTYTPRGVGQGQICLGFRGQVQFESLAFGGGPLESLLDVQVINPSNDATFTVDFDAATQEVLLDFSSISGDINSEDGPVVVFYFRVDDAVTAGTDFDLSIDLQNTELFDSQGRPIILDTREGRMTIRSPGAAVEIDAEGGEVTPGFDARITIETEESLPLASGSFTVTYDPTIAVGPAQVVHDPRYGDVTFSASSPQPGQIDVSFTSDGSLNRLPGELFVVEVPTRNDLALGSQSAVALNDVVFFDVQNQEVEMESESDPILFVAEEPLFSDGFEEGTAEAWCIVTP